VITRKSRREIEQMRRAGRIVAEVLALVESELRPGVTTGHLDRLAERHIRAAGATPSFLGYLGGGRYGRGPDAFPASTCISIDDEVVHGIPGERVIRAGQLVSVDVGAIVDGWHADAARTFGVGRVTGETERLLTVTRSALEAGIDAAQPGARLGNVSAAIQNLAESAGFSIVRDLVGHGIGQHLHEDPQVPNFGVEGRGLELEPGLVIAIEPMVNVGGAEVRTLQDAWTIVTIDGSLSAHFEHTVAITDGGPDILTRVA